ncbi:MAG TPA: N-acetylmuramoyl-L-alanine amidase [bacterium]|nr:N-acetylmuramoyl-L-alanine amidase [bacterium]
MTANPINNLVIHCSDSNWGCVREIRKWHMGQGWRDIGYHFVVLNGMVMTDFVLAAADGAIEAGRILDGDNVIEDNEVGAHALGYNFNSVGICLIGKTRFTEAQLHSLLRLCVELCRRYGIEPSAVVGHCETESGKAEGKTCPNIRMAVLRCMIDAAIQRPAVEEWDKKTLKQMLEV